MGRDYLIMLRMMVLIILKINEEFCLMSNRNEDSSVDVFDKTI